MKEEDDIQTLDTFYLGRIRVIQKRKGYRFSVDAPLLADFIKTKESDELLELGAGNGIISLLLSIKPFKHITAVEIQGSLADLARENIRLNRLEGRISIIHEDLRRLKVEKKFDVVFSNPPYIRKQNGHLSTSAEKSIAKHELKCDIFDIMHKTSELLKNKGRAYFIFPEKRREDFQQAVKRNRMKVKTIRFIYPRPESKSNLFLAECGFFSEGKVVLPPLFLYDESGNYTSETQEIFTGRIDAASA